MQNNIAARTQRFSESSHVWVEAISGATGSIEVQKYCTIRVRATGATTVTIDGVLAATMSTGEIMLFNVGNGVVTDTKSTVTVAIGAAAAFVQVGKLTELYPVIQPPFN